MTIGNKEIMEYIKGLDTAKISRAYGIDVVLDMLNALKKDEDDEAVDRLNKFLSDNEQRRYNLVDIHNDTKSFTVVVRIQEDHQRHADTFAIVHSNNVVALEIALSLEFKAGEFDVKVKGHKTGDIDDILRDIMGGDAE